MSVITYDDTRHWTYTTYPGNPITDMYIGSITASLCDDINKNENPLEKHDDNKNTKGGTTMPTGILTSSEIRYSLIRETSIFNADGSIKKVVFSGPATVVIWKDGTKTVVKCMEGDDYDPEKGLMMCIMEKLLGGKSAVKKLFKKHIPEEDTISIIESVARAMEELKASFAPSDFTANNKEENKE